LLHSYQLQLKELVNVNQDKPQIKMEPHVYHVHSIVLHVLLYQIVLHVFHKHLLLTLQPDYANLIVILINLLEPIKIQ
jgi:hypothetical protein